MKKYVVMPSMSIKEIEMLEEIIEKYFTSIDLNYYEASKVSDTFDGAVNIALCIISEAELRLKQQLDNVENKKRIYKNQETNIANC